MDAQRHERHDEWAAGIKAALAERQHRFEIQDLFADVTFRLPTAAGAAAKADQLGTTRFQGREAHGDVTQINKIDGQWIRDDGKKLSDIQDEIDRDSLRAIHARAEQRATLGPRIDGETDRRMALADAHAFRRIQNPVSQESAAVDMARNARSYREYKIGLDRAVPGYPGTAQKIYALDAAHEHKAVTMPEQGQAPPHGQEALNAVERDRENEQHPSDAPDTRHGARPRKEKRPLPQNNVGTRPRKNNVEPDEKLIVPPEIERQYLRVGAKFYHPRNSDLVAFEDKGDRLETKSNSEAIAASMVRIAEARGWDEIKVSGSETFRREVWRDAASRGMHVKGYTPSEQDQAELAKRVSQVDAQEVEKGGAPSRVPDNAESDDVKPRGADAKSDVKRAAATRAESFANDSHAELVRKHPELAGAAALAAVIDKQAEADGLTPQQRAVVMTRVRQNIVNSIERAHLPEVKVKEGREMPRTRDAHQIWDLSR